MLNFAFDSKFNKFQFFPGRIHYIPIQLYKPLILQYSSHSHFNPIINLSSLDIVLQSKLNPVVYIPCSRKYDDDIDLLTCDAMKLPAHPQTIGSSII